jgi:hypothetical protein
MKTKLTGLFLWIVLCGLLQIGVLFGQGAGNALNFGGTDEYVTMGAASNLRITGDLTFECWANIASAPVGAIYTLLDCAYDAETEAANTLYVLYILQDGTLRTRHESGTGVTQTAVNTTMIFGKWVHIAVIRDVTANTYQFVINGVALTAADYGLDPTGGTSAQTVIGSGYGLEATSNNGTLYALGFTTGQMEEVRIWNSALSVSTIQNWMNKKVTSSHPNFANLQGYWHLDETSGVTANDESANNYDGTLQNMEEGDKITSIVPIGDESIFSFADADIAEKIGCMIDVDLTAEAATTSYAVVQVNDLPNQTGGLLSNYPEKYWEIWASDFDFDGEFTANLNMHYDEISGIGDEQNLHLYRRDNATDNSWAEVSATINWQDGGSSTNADGDGYMSITITDATVGDYSGQYILTSSDGDNPLPVELVSFYAIGELNQIKLNWKTASELNNEGFEIYRSVGSEDNYQLLDSYISNQELKGLSNSSSGKTYTYNDHFVYRDLVYHYKLVDVDVAGNRTEHKAVKAMLSMENMEKIGESGLIDNYTLSQNYPNPFNPLTTIEFSIPDQAARMGNPEVTLSVYSVQGILVKNLLNGTFEPGQYRTIWDGTNLSGELAGNGVYFYHLRVSSGFVQTKRMILIK